MYYKKATYRDHFIKEFIKSLDTIESNINKDIEDIDCFLSNKIKVKIQKL